MAACNSGAESERLDEIEGIMSNNLDSARALLKAMPEPTSSEENIARYHLMYNWVKYAQYDQDFDLESLEKAFAYYKGSDDNLRKAQACYLKGAIYDQLKVGDEEQKAICYFSAAKAIEKTNNHSLAAQIYQRIAAEMNSRHMYSEALEWGQKYRNEAKMSGDSREEVIALLNLAMAHCWHSDSICEVNQDFEHGYVESIALSNEALQIAAENNNIDGMMRAYDKLSAFYSRRQNADSALHYALIADSLIYVVEANNPSRTKRGHTSLADAYRKVGKKLRAEYEATHNPATLKKVKDIAVKAMAIVENDSNHPKAQIRQNAAQLGYLISKDLLKDADLTFYYMGRFNHIQDSLQRHQQNIQVLTAPLRIEKEEVEATLDKTRLQLWSVLTICFLLLLAGSAATVIISRRNRRRIGLLQDDLNDALAAAEEKNTDSVATPITTVSALPETAAKAEIDEVPQCSGGVVTSLETVSSTAVSITDTAANELKAADVALPKVDPEQPIIIESATNESLSVKPADILYITVESNNLYIAYINNGKLTTKSVRSTMKVVDVQLLPFTNIVRCHRAFMVNLSHVKYAVTTSAGLSLLLDVNELIVPVSRSFVDSIKLGLKKYSQC